jgi:hypothetical protein
MKRINDWLNELTFLDRTFWGQDFVENFDDKIQKHTSILAAKYGVKNWTEDPLISHNNEVPLLGTNDMLIYIQEKLLHVDDLGKKYILRTIFGHIRFILHSCLKCNNEKREQKLLKQKQYAILFTRRVIDYFGGQLCLICFNFNFDANDVAGFHIREEIVKSVEVTDEKYKTLSRKERIACVYEILRKLGLVKTMDRVKLAEFIEAATGGNIEIKGKDTYTYHNIDYKVVPDKAKSMLKKLKL